MKDLEVLASDSHTLDGCDRVMLSGDQVIVQGKPGNRAGFPSIRVPDNEILSTSRSGSSWKLPASSSGG